MTRVIERRLVGGIWHTVDVDAAAGVDFPISLHQITFDLDDAQLTNLTTPVEVIAGIAGQIICPNLIVCVFVGSAYANDGLRVWIGDSYVAADWGDVKSNLSQADGRVTGFDFVPDGIAGVFTTVPNIAGKACSVDAGLNWAGGNGTLTTTITYTLMSVAV